MPAWLYVTVHVPVPLVIVMVTRSPLRVVVPEPEQLPLPATLTASPELAVAPTLKVALKAALPGAAGFTVMVWSVLLKVAVRLAAPLIVQRQGLVEQLTAPPVPLLKPAKEPAVAVAVEVIESLLCRVNPPLPVQVAVLLEIVQNPVAAVGVWVLSANATLPEPVPAAV